MNPIVAAERGRALLISMLQLPIHICLGRYEAATQEEIDDLITDLTHELARREAELGAEPRRSQG